LPILAAHPLPTRRPSDLPFPTRPEHVHNGIECCQRDSHVRGMCRDARLRGTEDRAVALIALPRGAAAARHTLAARLGDVLEIDRSEEHTSELQSPDHLVF